MISWYNEPIIIIIVSISLVAAFLVYSYLNWQKRKKNNVLSEKNLKQFYMDLIVLLITFSLLVIPMFFLL